MIEENDTYIIKPYKNRKKKELYIHNKDIREALSNHPIFVINEDITKIVKITKKVIINSTTYAELTKLLINLYCDATDCEVFSQTTKAFSQEKLNSLPSHIDITKSEIKNGYLEHLLKEATGFFAKKAQNHTL